MQLWVINLPQSSAIILKKIKILVLFEFIPTDEIKNFIYRLFGMADTLPEVSVQQDDIIEKVGVDRQGSSDLVENMGMMLIVLISIVFLVVFIGLVYALSLKIPKIRAFPAYVIGKICYNLFIRYILQSTISVLLQGESQRRRWSPSGSFFFRTRVTPRSRGQ